MEFNQLHDKLHRWIMLSLSVSVTSLVFRNVVGRLMFVQGGDGFNIQVGSAHTKNLRSTAVSPLNGTHNAFNAKQIVFDTISFLHAVHFTFLPSLW